MIDGLDGRFETAQAFLAEAAQATCEYDRKLFERVAARYWKAAIGMEDLGMDGQAVGAAVRPLRGD